MGGTRAYGEVDARPHGGTPHADWEWSVIGLAVTVLARGLMSVDRWRARQEELHPLAYVQMPYFERWLYSVERNLVLEGVLEEEEIEARVMRLADHPDEPLPSFSDPEFDAAIKGLIENGGPVVKVAPNAPRFAVGDPVRLLEIAITKPGEQHTRLPRYAQGKTGVIARLNPPQALPDAMVARLEERSEHTYAVRLWAAELWADAEPRSSVFVDCWESYLEPAHGGEKGTR